MVQCRFKTEDGSQCDNDVVDFICQHCSDRFCLAHLIEHAYDLNPLNVQRSSLERQSANNVKTNTVMKSTLLTPAASDSNMSCSSYIDVMRTSNTLPPLKSISTLDSSSQGSAVIFHPVAISTPATSRSVEETNTDVAFQPVSVLPTNASSSVLVASNNQDRIEFESSSSNNLPATNLLYSLSLNFTNKQKKKRLKSHQTTSHSQNNIRFNRENFYFNNIRTELNYEEAFTHIASTYPLIEVDNYTGNLPRIKYLCCANTSSSTHVDKSISIHLSFQNKVNFKKKFLNHIFPELDESDYLYSINSDGFNKEIKSSSDNKYIESSKYKPKRDFFVSAVAYRWNQANVATSAFMQESGPQAYAVLKQNLPYEYLTYGTQMRKNIEFELDTARRKKQINYNPIYERSTFKIPKEHKEKIEEWLIQDFKKRIEGTIGRCKCLFMVGPTQHGKTSWARSLGRHNFFAINFSLMEWRDDVEYIVLDDVNWKDISSMAKGLLIAPGQIILTDKYMAKKSIINNKPCIMCINEKEGRFIRDNDTDNYWEENGLWIFLKRGQKMY